jgi:tetratricopeptide (TPR) repeat protein
MLGRSWANENPGHAVGYYQLTRALAREGFPDSLGLAAAALGWEAQIRLRAQAFVPAIDLYLEQFASGDPTALVSLRMTASAALQASDKVLRQLAAHPRAQRAISAYVISGGWREDPVDWDGPFKEAMLGAYEAASARFSFLPAPAPDWHRVEAPAVRWLEAVERAGVKDVMSAEVLALAAYQSGDWDRASRWLDHASSTPLGRWLRAKLLLREGRTREAAALLSLLVRMYPGGVDGTPGPAVPGLAGSLYVGHGAEYLAPLTLSQQWSAEMGVFRLSRGQYEQSLDAFMHSAYWSDAAYVAERVLTVAELKDVVDRRWPEPAPRPAARARPSGEEGEPADELLFDETRRMVRSLRFLLARRLSRAGRWEEAREYYPPEFREKHGQLQAALQRGRDTNAPALERGRALFAAAKLVRHQGLELIGMEMDPDWRVYDGQFGGEHGLPEIRRELQASNLVVATSGELERADRHGAELPLRWHYRYEAAELAWEAARLLPDNDDLTSRVLCVGGTWLKYRAPEVADRFYKALVRRCRKTPLGKEADRLRWFPRVDGDGNPVKADE